MHDKRCEWVARENLVRYKRCVGLYHPSMAERELKTHALTIRFSDFEWSLLEQLGRNQHLTTSAAIRAAVIGYGREVLTDEEWRKICRGTAAIEWRDWQPPWRSDSDPRVAAIEERLRVVEETLKKVQARNGEEDEGT